MLMIRIYKQIVVKKKCLFLFLGNKHFKYLKDIIFFKPFLVPAHLPLNSDFDSIKLESRLR